MQYFSQPFPKPVRNVFTLLGTYLLRRFSGFSVVFGRGWVKIPQRLRQRAALLQKDSNAVDLLLLERQVHFAIAARAAHASPFRQCVLRQGVDHIVSCPKPLCTQTLS